MLFSHRKKYILMMAKMPMQNVLHIFKGYKVWYFENGTFGNITVIRFAKLRV